jgi:hypothetical protein
MIQIRQGVFETNSSSMHSIAIPKQTLDWADEYAYLIFQYGEFGWEFEQVDHLNYLYTALLYSDKRKEYIQHIKDVLDKYCPFCTYSFEDEYEDFGEDYNPISYIEPGYIDHGYEAMSEMIEPLMQDDELLLRYLFMGEVYTGSDNYEECETNMCNCSAKYTYAYKEDEDGHWVEEQILNPNHKPDTYDYLPSRDWED